MDTAKIETLGVLAGAYRGGRQSLNAMLTHSVREGSEDKNGNGRAAGTRCAITCARWP